MKFIRIILFVSVLLFPVSAVAAGSINPTLDLEKKIAYGQGQFGALYAHCGSKDDQAVIGGSLTTWKMETFRGYRGSPAELAALQSAFDDAAKTASADDCHDWIKEAAATWHSVAYLSQYGTPVAANQ